MVTKILHVDDDPEWIELVEEALTAEGYNVCSFSALAEARSAADDRFGAIIVDGLVHGKSGFQWACDLVEAGHENVIVLSRLEPGAWVPHVNKADWADGGKERLLSLVRGLVEP